MIDYAISDLHLDHNNIREMADRPYDTVEQMNNALVTNWNETVATDDTVLFLGDLAIGSRKTQKEYLEKLNGNIIFIRGNHDDLTNQSNAGVIYDEIGFSQQGISFYCTHKPIHTTNSPKYNLTGHSHNDRPFYNPGTKEFNLSVEVIGYKPIPMEQIINIIRTDKNKQRQRFTP